MNTFGNSLSNRQAAVQGLAVVGFVSLMALGIWLAVYSTRYVPSVVGRIGSAAIYLGSVFTPAPDDSSLSVIPVASTTIPVGAADPVAATSTAASTDSTITPPKPIVPTPGKVSTSTAQIGGTTTIQYGLPDLTVKINAVGYLATTSAESFVASSTVPAGSRPAVRFTIKNIGTNVSGPWRFSASIPTQNTYIYQSPTQQSLAPNDSIDYVLGFDQATSGDNKTVSITTDFELSIKESDESNNVASTSIKVLGN